MSLVLASDGQLSLALRAHLAGRPEEARLLLCAPQPRLRNRHPGVGARPECKHMFFLSLHLLAAASCTPEPPPFFLTSLTPLAWCLGPVLTRPCISQALFDPDFNELSPAHQAPGPESPLLPKVGAARKQEAAESFGLSACHGSQTVTGVPNNVGLGNGSPQREEAGHIPTC